MKKNILWMIFLCLMIQIVGCTVEKNEYNIIPYPQDLIELDGQFIINNTCKVLYSGSQSSSFVAQSFCDFIQPATGISIDPQEVVGGDIPEGTICFYEDSTIKGIEGSYQLEITPEKILVKSNNSVGLYYGFQTIRQLLPVVVESNEKCNNIDWTVPCATINDAPELSYRGLHLDVGRHFYPVDFIKKYIDLLALHKMNVFHWHLTEDQGWRIEIKKYPKLAEIAAFRDETLIGDGGTSNPKYDGKRYGGFYTQEQAREIVKYAADRFITVIPEIELPGHAQAALAAYPEFGCVGGSYEVAKRWGVSKEVYCAGNEKSFEFLEDVLLEVMDIFPSKYIHIGGDECPKDRWNECPKCKNRMYEENFKDAHELQSYFIGRIEKFLNKHGRNIIGWDEILEGGLAPNATVMSWRGIKGGIEAAKQKHNVIMTPNSHFYLDHYQNNPEKEPLAIGGFLTLQKVYSYNPFSEELTKDEMKYIIGVQGNLWTEYMPTSDHVEYMAYPRACAISEVGWLPFEKRNFEKFSIRMKRHFKRLDLLGVNYFNKVLMPKASVSKVEFIESETLEFSNVSFNANLYYTLDGTIPDQTSKLYKEPIVIDKEGVVKAIAINEEGEESEVLVIKAVKLQFIEGKSAVGNSKGLNSKLCLGKFSSCDEVDVAEGDYYPVLNIQIPNNAPQYNFGIVLEGKLKIHQNGLYKFRLGSDDGSMFYLNNNLVIDNDGDHGMEYKNARLALNKGVYPVKFVYFQGTGGEGLKFEVETPDGSKIDEFTEFLSH
ncbi:family 20 glycosylhydrolase [Labilibaculum antarcticum]|uniref:beta-N-acetylhexosaminidase n=1 Tax=Labilibaculum antarcticum TaxID=1717717 RepID=A0A1Y1CIY5_9BACT|nr:family 20 glycosylhydrolase [Labilibaculum antarcticum]BAX79972.1 beta-N-acetylhexosaminidase [Labilibaculum antarcticum]